MFRKMYLLSVICYFYYKYKVVEFCQQKTLFSTDN